MRVRASTLNPKFKLGQPFEVGATCGVVCCNVVQCGAVCCSMLQRVDMGVMLVFEFDISQ